MFFKKIRDTMIFGAVLLAFTVYVLLDTFLIPHPYETASQDGSAHAAVEEGYAADSGNAEEGYAAGFGNAEEKTGEDSASPSKRGNGEKGSKRPGRHKRSSSDASEEASGDNSEDIGNETTAQDLPLSGGAVIDRYQNGTANITLSEYRVEDTEIYVADIVLQEASALQTAFADQTYGKNVTAKTSEIASGEHAILAINGDFYGAREKGYVIRNGTLYRDSSAGDQEDLVIYADGSFEIINENSVSANALVEKGAMQVFSFGPALVENGQLAVSANAEVGKSMASNPRTAIGIIDSLHYVFVVSDGRTQDSEGLSLSELGAFMQGLGVTTAYNLDGGGSSTMYFNGNVINNPTTSGRSIKERSVSDIVYIQ